MVHEPHDGPEAQLAQAPEAAVGPATIGSIEAVRSRALPEHGVAQAPEPEGGQEVEVPRAVCMAGAFELVVEDIPDPVDRALHTTPQLEGPALLVVHSAAPSVMTRPWSGAIWSKVARA